MLRLSIFGLVLAFAFMAASMTAVVRYIDTTIPIIDRNDEFFNSSTYGGFRGQASQSM